MIQMTGKVLCYRKKFVIESVTFCDIISIYDQILYLSSFSDLAYITSDVFKGLYLNSKTIFWIFIGI